MPRSLKRNWKKSLDTVEEGESSGGERDNGSDSLDSDQGNTYALYQYIEMFIN